MDNLSRNEICLHCCRWERRGITADVIIKKDGRILLIKRANEPFRGFWALPGGYIEWDESAEDAAKREVEEETGLKIISATQLKVYSDPTRDPKQTITILFMAEAEGEPKAGDDAAEFRLFDINNLPENLAFDHRRLIEDHRDKLYKQVASSR